MRGSSRQEKSVVRATFVAGLMVRLLVAALFVRVAFWFVQTFVAAKADFAYITHGSMAAIAVLYTLGCIGYRLERTIRNDLMDTLAHPSDKSPAVDSPFANRDL